MYFCLTLNLTPPRARGKTGESCYEEAARFDDGSDVDGHGRWLRVLEPSSSLLSAVLDRRLWFGRDLRRRSVRRRSVRESRPADVHPGPRILSRNARHLRVTPTIAVRTAQLRHAIVTPCPTDLAAPS